MGLLRHRWLQILLSGLVLLVLVVTTAIVVGTIIGSGIFMLPVSLAPLGYNAIIGWVISGVGVVCIAYALGRLSRLGGDGIQANVENEFGATPGFLVAWSFWVSNWVAQAAVAVHAAGLRRGRLVDAGVDVDERAVDRVAQASAELASATAREA